MEATAIILAGGASSRMGKNKALLSLGEYTVIEWIVSELMKLTDHVLIVTNSSDDFQFLDLPMVEDEWKGKGPLAGIQAGLHDSKTEKNLVVACDMPFISADVGRILLDGLEDDFLAVVPQFAGRLHPLFAAYHKKVHKMIQPSLSSGDLSMRRFLEQVPVKIMRKEDFENQAYLLKDIDFFNMNDKHAFIHALNIHKNRNLHR